MSLIRKLGFGLLVLVVLLGGLGILTDRAAVPALFPPGEAAETVPVRITLSYRWQHAELAVPRDLIEEAGGPAAEALRAVGPGDWILLGWGDAAYYRERGLTDARLMDFLRSMLAPDNPSVVEMNPEAAAPAPETTGKAVLSLDLSRAGAERMIARLNASFSTRSGHPVAVGSGRDPGSQFFVSRERSDLASNCNHWVADLLHAGGVPVNGLLATISPGLALDLRWRAGAAPVPGDEAGYRPSPEVPPTYSGRYEPLPGEDAPLPEHALPPGDLVFEGYRVAFGETAPAMTSPAALVPATTPYAAGRPSFAALLGVPEDSLVGIRTIVERSEAPEPLRICSGRPPSHLAFGFEANDGGPYEISVAAFSAPPGPATSPDALCATGRYIQP